MGIPRPLAAWLIGLSILCTSACSDGDTRVETDPPPSAPGGGVPVRGTERLAWEQYAPSYSQLRRYAFTVFVDGNAAALTGVQCVDATSPMGFPCSASLPSMSNGTHQIQIAAVADGVEGARSSTLTVNMTQSRIVVPSEGSEAAALGSGDRQAALTFCTESGDACFTARREITRPVPISSPTTLPDGRLLFVEDGRAVRIIVDGVVRDPMPALRESTSRVVAVLVDPAFERTRLVRIASIDETARGRTLSITRYREVQHALGEPIVIVDGVPLPSTGIPVVAQDPDGRVYVAVPSGDVDQGRSDVAWGFVLRFAADGLTWSAGLGPPLFARGFDEPHALSIDSRGERVWLAGANRGRGSALRAIAQPGAPAPLAGYFAAARPITGLAALAAAQDSPRTEFLMVDPDGTLSWTRAEDGALTSARVGIGSEHAVGIGTGAGGTRLLATRSDAEGRTTFSVFRMERVGGRGK